MQVHFSLAQSSVSDFFQPFIPMSAKIAVDLKLFEYLVAKNGPVTVTELATLSGAEELLIGMFSFYSMDI